MGRAPLIAVTGRRRSAAGLHLGPPALDALEIEGYFTGYADHLVAAGALPVHLPARVDPVVAIDRVDALVLTGGSDVDPGRYGAPVCATTSPLDPERDAFELALLDAALERGRPVLAICRGLQLVNVSRGGTLHAHLAEHHPASGRHAVAVEPGSVLHALYGPATVVNSLHHQGVDRLGADLVVTARAPDGVVEGIELPGARLVGVQWHPEQMGHPEQTGHPEQMGHPEQPGQPVLPQPLFGWLVDAAR